MDRGGDQPDQTTPRPNPATQSQGDPFPPPQPRTETEYTPRPATSSTDKFDDGMTSGGESSPPREKVDPYNRGGGITIATPPRARSSVNYRPPEPIMMPIRRNNSGADWVAPNLVS